MEFGVRGGTKLESLPKHDWFNKNLIGQKLDRKYSWDKQKQQAGKKEGGVRESVDIQTKTKQDMLKK